MLPLLCFLTPLAHAVQDEPEPLLTYRDGLRLRNETESVRLRVNGRVMYDMIDADSRLEPALEDDEEFRRVRLLAQADVSEHVGVRAQWDFSDSQEELLELMMDWRTFPGATLRVGHFREPFGLNARTSSAAITFLERSAPTDAFTYGRNRGVQLRERFERGSWALGAFREADEVFHELGDNEAFTARVTWLPRWEADGEQLVHLGLGLTHRDTSEDGVRLSARPEAHLVERLVDTGDLDADDTDTASAEAAWVDGRWSAQGELFVSRLDLQGGDAQFFGASVEGSWFLTGEHKAYRESSSSFGRVAVLEPLLGGNGWGAWELAARWSHTDLEDGDVEGGVMDDVTLGLNWYLNDHSRVMLNYIHVEVDDSSLDGDLFLVRLQLGF